MRRKPKYYKHGVQREKMYGGKTKKYYRLLGKGLKERDMKSWYILQFISEIGIWTMAEKETRTQWTTFFTYMSNFISLCGPAAHYDLKLRTEHLPNM